MYEKPKPTDLEQLKANNQIEILNTSCETFYNVMNNVVVDLGSH